MNLNVLVQSIQNHSVPTEIDSKCKLLAVFKMFIIIFISSCGCQKWIKCKFNFQMRIITLGFRVLPYNLA